MCNANPTAKTVDSSRFTKLDSRLLKIGGTESYSRRQNLVCSITKLKSDGYAARQILPLVGEDH